MRTPHALTAVAVVAALFTAVTSRPASGAGDATGSLASGGTAKGDISTEAGETDAILIDLVGGSRLDVKWSSGFAANVSLLAPGGAPLAIGLDGVKKATANAIEVPTTGSYRFEIRSADGTQGFYTLQAKPYWDKTVVLEGAGEQTFDVAMPATGRIKGKVQPLPGASNPSITSFIDPNGTELLVAPIVGSTGLAKLKTTTCGATGDYRFTALASAGTQGFRATLKRSVPRQRMTKIDVSNGIMQISLESSGLAQYVNNHCASCHSWAGAYAGVRAYAKQSLVRMRSGNMPPGGPRADAATLAKFEEWIKTGYGR